MQGDRRLSARLAAAVMSVPAIKGVEIGLGFAAAGLPGSQVHDALGIRPSAGYVRASNTPAASRAASPPGSPSSCAPP